MAKGARASTTKANNARLKSKVFGPVETARAERLSAKLLELVSQPKPKPEQKDVIMDTDEESSNTKAAPTEREKQTEAMEVDQAVSANPTKSKSSKGRIEKKRFKSSRKASIVFPKYQKSGVTGKTRKK